jgi:hypothetical protein
MHLVICARPEEPLEVAPQTALLAEPAEGDQWEGFWSAESDDYFVRRTRVNGATEWFRVEDDAGATRTGEGRPLEIRPASRGRVSLIVARSPNGRRMLVGSARRSRR